MRSKTTIEFPARPAPARGGYALSAVDGRVKLTVWADECEIVLMLGIMEIDDIRHFINQLFASAMSTDVAPPCPISRGTS